MYVKETIQKHSKYTYTYYQNTHKLQKSHIRTPTHYKTHIYTHLPPHTPTYNKTSYNSHSTRYTPNTRVTIKSITLKYKTTLI